MAAIPAAWYNLLADVQVDLPPDLPSPRAVDAPRALNVPLALIRQESSRRRWLPIPEEILSRYRQWRPTPLWRARSFELAIDTKCRVYVKYEGANVSGSHKLTTAVAQAHFYKRAGVTRLTAGTGAGQWGSALAAACAMFGLECQVYMVRSSLEAKPYRKTMMELLGASVIASPSSRTAVGRRAIAKSPGSRGGTLSVALAEAGEDGAAIAGSAFAAGSGEGYALLHQTVMGVEAGAQLAELGESVDVVVGSMGAGSNFAGLAFPFLGRAIRDGRAVRCAAVEPTACPKLTRGRYAYDYTDESQVAPLQMMYTLGHTFAPPAMHAGGLRYHGSAKLVSALHHAGMIDAMAVPQRAVFDTATTFLQAEGVLPAPESAHALHGAALAAKDADDSGRSIAILVGVTGHGMLDLNAYESFLDGTMTDASVSDAELERSLADLPLLRSSPGASL